MGHVNGVEFRIKEKYRVSTFLTIALLAATFVAGCFFYGWFEEFMAIDRDGLGSRQG